MSKTSANSLITSSPPDLLDLFSMDRQITYIMSRTSNSWINLGAFGINILSIKQNLDDSKASPFVELKDTDASKSGRPPKVNGSIPNLKARRSKTDSMTVVWTLRNVAHHDHVRTFATKFESQREAELFLLIFNGLAAEVEERRNKAYEDNNARVKKSLFSSVVAKTTPTTGRSSSSINGVCPSCNNGGAVGKYCDNCGAIFEQDNGSTTDDGSHDSSSDDGEGSVILLVSEMSGMGLDRAKEEVDADEDNKDDSSFEDDFTNTQEWPADHSISHPAF